MYNRLVQDARVVARTLRPRPGRWLADRRGRTVLLALTERDESTAGALAASGAGTIELSWCESAKTALERAVVVARDRGDTHIGPRDVLLGLLGAEHGTVARVLRREGVEPSEIEARLEDAD